MDSANKSLLADLQRAITEIESRDAASRRGVSPLESATCDDVDLKAAPETRNAYDKAASKEATHNCEDVFSRIVKIVSFRDYSEAELRSKLEAEEFSDECIAQALARAVSCGLVDDNRFADAYIRGRLAAGKGIEGIRYELSKRGIDASNVPGWPDEYLPFGEEGEFERALQLLERKPPRSKNLREGAFRKLVSHGFSVSVAQNAARAWLEHEKL